MQAGAGFYMRGKGAAGRSFFVASIRQPFFAFRARYLRMIWRPSVALPTLCSVANRSSRSKSGISSGIVTVRVVPPANVTARCRRVYARS